MNKNVRKDGLNNKTTVPEFAERVKEIRALSGKSQQEFADMFGLSKYTLQDWEHGRRTPPDHLKDMYLSWLSACLCAAPARTKKDPVGLKDIVDSPAAKCFSQTFNVETLKQYDGRTVTEDLFWIMKCAACVKRIELSEDGCDCVMIIEMRIKKDKESDKAALQETPVILHIKK